MEENTKTFFKKPSFGRKPYRVDAKALESKGFEMIRYDRHESYAKTYRIDSRTFIGTVNPVTGDRTISKAGPFASVKDMEDLRVAWDQLSADVLGPRPETAGKINADATTTLKKSDVYVPDVANEWWKVQVDNSIATATTSPVTPIYNVHDLTEDKDSVKCPHCGKSHYQVDNAKTTTLSMPTIVRDGHVVPQPDINRTTYSCTCLECGKQFETTQDPLGTAVPQTAQEKE